MTILKSKIKYIWLILLLLVLLSNTILYNTQIGKSTLPTNTEVVVFGSLLDLIVIAPIAFLLYKQSFSWKWFIGLMATGCVLARFIIPSDYLQPFHAITWSGILAEGALFLMELSLIVVFVRYLPKIIKDVKESYEPLLFSFPQAVEKYVKRNPLIFAICMELLLYYFAIASWKKKASNGFTLYKNSSIIPFQIMILHAIVLETVGIHWLLHILHVPLWVSIMLLLVNIYGVIFILGDLQALRLNPVQIKNGSLYIS